MTGEEGGFALHKGRALNKDWVARRRSPKEGGKGGESTGEHMRSRVVSMSGVAG